MDEELARDWKRSILKGRVRERELNSREKEFCRDKKERIKLEGEGRPRSVHDNHRRKAKRKHRDQSWMFR